MYKRLRELEDEMDESIQRKKRQLDMQVRSNPHISRRKLRVRVYHMYSRDNSSWTLRIEGKIMDGEVQPPHQTPKTLQYLPQSRPAVNAFPVSFAK